MRMRNCYYQYPSLCSLLFKSFLEVLLFTCEILELDLKLSQLADMPKFIIFFSSSGRANQTSLQFCTGQRKQHNLFSNLNKSSNLIWVRLLLLHYAALLFFREGKF